ncbi:SMP-30/gluconolactonase/LRE family protein [Cognatishimia sp. SS12]|uniref:SMP-30/gluconolactonase/LRE family protein n=1 Tax=Cognatishimia sp. SS12 TaxID=2979465 RepID=UPI002330EE4E|nr:SMP-30/gluconolactonase/LRE family protein [Cognatishimia sp. SS12]MDC0739624.1 SMP-30/gluconolactonase/LRE family protein [Cognatishimia sp. SS12]
MKTAICVDPVKSRCGEGLLWDETRGLLWWVDIAAHTLCSHAPGTGVNRKIAMPGLISALALHESGRLLIATKSGLGWVDPDSGAVSVFDCPEPDKPFSRPNDMAVDQEGALWLGTMSEGAKGPFGALYRYGAGGRDTALSETTISNGLDWSPDGSRFYFIDSVPGRIWLYTQDEWSILRTCDEDFGRPDGMCVDSAGTLWVAICNKGCVLGLDQDGNVIDKIEIPCRIVTNCAFGGADLSTLYVTTGTFDLSPEEMVEQPYSGGLFAVQMDVPGKLPNTAKWPEIPQG